MDIITLLSDFASGLTDAGKTFYESPEAFRDLEQTVVDLSHRAAAQFLSLTLTQMDEMICQSGMRKRFFKIIRHDRRTLITTAGDVTFQHTLFLDTRDGSRRYLLDEQLHLPDRERFSTQAEARVLQEAEVHSYQHAADSLQIGQQKVSKTAVMHKVHSIEKELLPAEELPPAQKKWCEYLYIDADEDHIHTQKNPDNRNGLIGKLVYVYEGKEALNKGKSVLVSPHYFSGLYEGAKGNAELWKSVQQYIEGHYNTEVLKKVYINGDGGNWIRAGVDYVDNSVFVADRFHLMKYINSVANCTLDERDITKGRFYRYIYKDNLLAAKKLLTRIQNHCDNSDKAVEACRSYLINNWAAIHVAFHDPHVLGCSAEGHVSNVLSDRMSSRPMGWSEVGSDRMCRLRTYVRNNSSERIVDLVAYRRERAFAAQEATRKANGTDGMLTKEVLRAHYTKQQREAFRYVEALQATIGGDTVRKTLAIRQRLSEL